MFNDRYGLTKAVLGGRKTMIRRIVRNPKEVEINSHKYLQTEKLRYKVGEIVAVSQPYKDVFTNGLVNPFVAKAGWTNKMFVRADLMPYQIRITNIHIERLQEISDKDCMREGIYVSKTEPFVPNGYSPYCANDPKEPKEWFHTPREAFAALIDKVSGRGTWESNPWVFVYQFELVE